MEVSGGGVGVFRSIPSTFSGAGAAATHSQSSSSSSFLGVSGSRFNADLRLNRPTTTCRRKFSNSGFGDKGHIHYYSSTMIRCGATATATAGNQNQKQKEKEKEEGCSSTMKMKTKTKTKKQQLKKKIKLLKGLSEDLSVFSDMGFGLAPDHGLVAQVKGKMISDAAELLLAQLQKLKAEEKELKRKKKEDKAELKAARMQNRLDCEAESSSSSSSSSESSDSECGEVVDMGRLKTQSSLAQPVLKELTLPNTLLLPKEGEVQPAIVVIREAAGGSTTTPLPIVSTQKHEEGMGFGARNTTSQILEQECCTSCSKTSVALGSSIEGSSLLVGVKKKIEVCMGGKCKKSGAPALLEEFQRMVGVEGAAVVGCKCMGKCRDGPNVRVVLNHLDSDAAAAAAAAAAAQADDDSVRTPPSTSKHPLCIGVGLEDVGLILSNFFGEEAQTDDMGGLAAAS